MFRRWTKNWDKYLYLPCMDGFRWKVARLYRLLWKSLSLIFLVVIQVTFTWLCSYMSGCFQCLLFLFAWFLRLQKQTHLGWIISKVLFSFNKVHKYLYKFKIILCHTFMGWSYCNVFVPNSFVTHWCSAWRRKQSIEPLYYSASLKLRISR